MDQILYIVLTLLQFIATAALCCEILYVSFLKPSRFQMELLLLMISTVIMLIGYSIELYAVTPEAALTGTAISYLGKPFAMLMSLVFIADFCGRPLHRPTIITLFFCSIFFFLIVLTNGVSGRGHFLYYSSVDFDINNIYSPLILEHGPLYWTYVVYLVVMFSAILLYIIIEFKNSKAKESRKQLNLLFCMIASTFIGYLLFMTGITKGYDTTMTGAAVGAFFLTVVFFRYKLYDSLTLAKEHALHNAATGLLVLNEQNKAVYTNDLVDNLLSNTFTTDELIELTDGESIIEKGNSVYEVTKSSIEKKGVRYGHTLEINDISTQYRYNIQLQHDIEERTREIVNIQRSVITSFAGIVEARDSSTGAHIKRLSHSVELIARSLRNNGFYTDILDDRYINRLTDVAALHDIGKIKIPDSVLLKPGKLTDDEFDVIKKHTVFGEQIVKECLYGVESEEYVELACSIARYHHEKWNGSGYPEGLSGNDIPLAARIVSVADVYDAVREERCYKRAMTKEEACEIILQGKGVHFDPAVVDAFMAALHQIEQHNRH